MGEKLTKEQRDALLKELEGLKAKKAERMKPQQPQQAQQVSIRQTPSAFENAGTAFTQGMSGAVDAYSKGFSQLTGTGSEGFNPIAASLNLNLGTARAGQSLLNTGMSLVKGIPVLGDVVSTLEKPIAAGTGVLQNLFSKGIQSGTEALGGSEQFARQIAEPGGELGSQAAIAGAGLLLGKGSRALRGGSNIERSNVAFDRAFPRGVADITRPVDRARALPYVQDILEKSPLTKPGRGQKTVARGGDVRSTAFQLAKEKFPEIKSKIYSDLDDITRPFANEPLSGGATAIANEVESLRNVFTKNIDILKDKSILDEAAKYRNLGEITLSQARDLLRHLNANLGEFYKKSPESQAAIEAMAKPIAEMERAAGSIREQIVRTLDDLGADSKTYREKSLDYGSIARLEGSIERNISRHESPVAPLMTQTGSQFYPSKPGAIREIGEQTIGRLSTPEALARKSMRLLSKEKKKPYRKFEQGLKGPVTIGTIATRRKEEDAK